MSENTFVFSLSRLDKVIFEDSVRSVYCPGSEGDLTILAHHAALVTALRPGIVRVRTEDGIRDFPVKKGILEVKDNRAFILL